MKQSRLFICIFLIFTVSCTSACSARKDENIGVYTCARLEMDGEEFYVLDVYPEGCSLELSQWGQAWLNIGDESFYGRWTQEGETFSLDINGEISSGSLKDGLCTLKLSDNDMLHSFLKEGANLPEKAAPVQQALTEQQIFWNGDWYGRWTVENAQGEWQEQSGQSFDCFASIDIDSEGNGELIFWDELQSKAQPLAVVDISIVPDEGESVPGLAVSTGGKFLDTKLKKEQWTANPDAYPADSVFFIENAHYEGKEASFDYSILLRPWGRTWEDIEEIAPDKLPFFYYDWYLPALASGSVMPEQFDFPEKTVIRNTWQETEPE